MHRGRWNLLGANTTIVFNNPLTIMVESGNTKISITGHAYNVSEMDKAYNKLKSP